MMKPITLVLRVGTLAACTILFAATGVAASQTLPAKPFIGLPSAHSVAAHRYVDSVQLDRGALRVVPAPKGDEPSISRADALTKMLANTQTMGYRAVVLGFGLVTISSHASGVPTVKSLPAWIGFSKEYAAYSCPAMIAPANGETTTTLPTLPSDGYAAFVLDAAKGSPAVTFVAASEPCGKVVPSSVGKASEVISIPWQATGPLVNGSLPVRTTIPPCGTLRGISSGGSAASATITLDVTVPDVHGQCNGAKSVTETVNLGVPNPAPGSPPPVENSGTEILHGAVGPTNMESPA